MNSMGKGYYSEIVSLTSAALPSPSQSIAVLEYGPDYLLL